MEQLFNTAPVPLMGVLVLALMLAAAACGMALRRVNDRSSAASATAQSEGLEGYIVSAVLGLLALLMGFTFALAVDRFEIRRGLVLQEANAIGTTYLRAQLLEEPHRTRVSRLLVEYADNRITLARTGAAAAPQLLATNDRLVTDLWTATVAAFPTVKDMDFSTAFVEGMNEVIDLDAARKAARQARVPSAVFGVLIIYVVATAGVLGYVLGNGRGRLAAGFLLPLVALSLMLVVDIDRPVNGGVREGQGPMEALRASL